ncbi:SRPBCC domain-containing protein [Aeromonas molluscorum]|uniref:SRPBCC domain-containing protein n=1 Tax=Aeromonas molluscorum TaxID=271417 RepID=UPI003F1D4D86
MTPLKWAMVQANFHSVALETVNTELLMRRLAPKPWRPLSAELDVKVGGASLVVMGGPNSEPTPCPGNYLLLEPGRRIVSTDAYERPCQPSARPFMTLILSFTSEGEGTRYRAWVRHWS